MSVTPLKRRLRHALRALWITVALVVILAGALVAAISVAMPWVVNNPQKVQAFISDSINRPISFSKLSASWETTGPLLVLEGVSLGKNQVHTESLEIERAQLAIDLYRWVLPNYQFTNFQLVGIQLVIERDESGWKISRLGNRSTTSSANPMQTISSLGNIQLREARVVVADHMSGNRIELSRVDAELVNHSGRFRVIGEVWIAPHSAPLKFNCDASSSDGLCYLAGTGLEPAQWLAQAQVFGVSGVAGRLDVQLWADWSEQGQQLRAEFTAQDMAFRGVKPITLASEEIIEARGSIPDLQGYLRLRKDAAQMQVDLKTWSLQSPENLFSQLSFSHVAATKTTTLHAKRVDFAQIAMLAALSEIPSNDIRRGLYLTSLQGAAQNIFVHTEADAVVEMRAKIEDVSWNSAGGIPGISAISGNVLGDGSAIAFIPSADQQIEVNVPAVFRQAFSGVLHTAPIVLMHIESGWRVESSDFAFSADEFRIDAAIALDFVSEGGKPFLDARAKVSPTKVQTANLFWPTNAMPAPVIEWLDRGLLGGEISEGGGVFRGDLDDWPFISGEGRFEAQAHLSDFELMFHPEWPVATDLDLDVRFLNRAMFAEINEGKIAGNTLAFSLAKIPVLAEAELQLDAQGSGSGKSLLDLLQASPLTKSMKAQLLGVTIGGDADIAFTMSLPLTASAQAVKSPSVDGKVFLRNADLGDAKLGLLMKSASGPVRFSHGGFSADELATTLDEQPVSFSLASGNFTSSSANSIEASLRGDLSAQTLWSRIDKDGSFNHLLQGNSQWSIALHVPTVDANTQLKPRLVLDSTLLGTSINLPAPLSKGPDAPVPFHADIELPFESGLTHIALGEVVDIVARLPGPAQIFAVDAVFGGAEQPQREPQAGFHASGSLVALDISGWLEELKHLHGNSEQSTDISADLQAFEMSYGKYFFSDGRLQVSSEPDQLALDFSGPDVQGQVLVPKSQMNARGVTARFDKLQLTSAPIAATNVISTNPASIPPLHLWAKELNVDSGKFGEFRVEALPMENGLQFELLETSSPMLTVRGRGQWTLQNAQEVSDFDITFTSQDLGQMLGALGFDGLIEGGQTIARLNGKWAGSPAQFSLATVNGELSASVGQGRMLEVEPGTGRLFGLMSLQALPRRLSLDFSDFFKAGLAFDAIDGNFTLLDGNAFTENLAVKSPAANIHISGRTGLAAKDYDQKMRVTPNPSVALSVLGGLAAGPAGIAAGAVVQGVLSGSTAGETIYRVTGPWEKPEVVAEEKLKSSDAPKEAKKSTPKELGAS